MVVFKRFGHCSFPFPCCYDHFPCPDSALLRSLYENQSLASNHWRALFRHRLKLSQAQRGHTTGDNGEDTTGEQCPTWGTQRGMTRGEQQRGMTRDGN